jgi:hypothetical protein
MYRAVLFPAPEIREFSRIRSFSGNSTENSTENSVLFQNWSKTSQKATKWYQNIEKAPKIAQNFYIFVRSIQKSSLKLPIFKKKIPQNLSVFVKSTQKSSRKAPEFWRDLNLGTALVQGVWFFLPPPPKKKQTKKTVPDMGWRSKNSPHVWESVFWGGWQEESDTLYVRSLFSWQWGKVLTEPVYFRVT